jgi:hypothetical protein
MTVGSALVDVALKELGKPVQTELALKEKHRSKGAKPSDAVSLGAVPSILSFASVWTISQIGVAIDGVLVAQHHDKAGGCPSLYGVCRRAVTTKPKKPTG